MLEDCQTNKLGEDEAYILYIHSKGVSKENNKCVKDWVDYLSYFNIYNFNTCLSRLEELSTHCVGVNLQISDTYPIHYSGNFWWSKMSHIKTLKSITNNIYNAPEFWVTSNSNNKYVSLWNSNVNHYYEAFPSSLYS